MNPGELPEGLLRSLLAAGSTYRLALAGGYAAVAHGLTERTGSGLGLATDSSVPMPDIAAAVTAELERRGWLVTEREAGPLVARFVVAGPGGPAAFAGVVTEVGGVDGGGGWGDVATGPGPVGGGTAVLMPAVEVHAAKEALWHPPVATPIGLALSLEDLVGTKVRALADRGLARDLVHVHAVADRWGRPDLEELGRRHAPDTFDLSDLQARLAGAEWTDDREFRTYGVSRGEVVAIRVWAQEWADDLAERLLEGAPPPEESPDL
ncbi:hypothetical protein GT204_23315 [Streptomyces sp. SID4919]|uniref:hypothetical protein n=1 Tax=unclassified Streptomyces TaxID=2593676 RepID=UPI000C0800EC|nr:hypothetical protein [Streptomyces sp. SID4919]